MNDAVHFVVRLIGILEDTVFDTELKIFMAKLALVSAVKFEVKLVVLHGKAGELMGAFSIASHDMPLSGYVISFVGDGDVNIDMDDVPHAPIVDVFDTVYDAIQGQPVVQFRCQAGESRSCTLLIAMYMKIEGLPLVDAMCKVKKQHPRVSVNDGFKYQLQIYKEMNCRIDKMYPPYRKFKAWSLMCTRESHGCFSDQFEPDPMHASTRHLRCGQCRRKLVIYDPSNDHRHCSKSYMVPPTQWMQVSELQGKLKCPRCQQKVGAYLWQGRECTCGEFVAPYFSLSASKVDLMD